MEYEKHIKTLVLGFLKGECKNVYKIYKKTIFQSHHKHITTRVAGQSLEDILKTYSRIQDIVHSYLEDTDYYKENGAGFTSPAYLPEQLLYLLDRDRPLTPVSTIYDRSCASSPVSKEIHRNEEIHYRDVETTPEHTLPGNMCNVDDDCHSKTPFRRKGSPIFRTPYLENLSNSEHENISSVLTTKLLEKPEFHKKLARNINSALNTPAFSCSTRKDEGDKVEEEELEGAVRVAITRTQADPMFEDLLQEFLDPIGNTISKAIAAESTSPNSSSCTSPSKNMTNNMDDHNNGAVSSILAVSNGTNQSNPNNNGHLINVVQNENINKLAPVVTSEKACDIVEHSDQHSSIASEQTNDKVTSSEQVGPVQQSYVPSVETQPITYTPTIYTVPSSSTNHPASQQQQYFIVNQPLIIPQSMQLVQPIPAVGKPIVIDTSKKVSPKITANLTEQDIMSMPTIILNERNEVTYADPGSLTMTPYKPNEVHNIKEYLNVFGATDQSPIIKKRQSKTGSFIKPTPTIKVEIFNRDEPLKNVETIQDGQSENSHLTKQLPNLCDAVKEVVSDGHSKGSVNEETSKSISNDNNMNSNDKTKSKSLNSACTPSPLVITTVRKPTPKSGSHVRNLTFPSPLRKTSEKPDGNRNSPSDLNKQQASKDLFKEKLEESRITTENKKSSKGKSRTGMSAEGAKESEHPTVPKKTSSPKKRTSPKKSAKKTAKKNTKIESTIEHKTPESWDAALRKNVPIDTNQTQQTPVRRTSVRKRVRRSTELDVSDPDGKKLEEALKTPGRGKSKTPTKKKPVKADKPKPEKKVAKVDEVPKVETKKVLSPSKLCNTASKRNMEVDGITPNAPKETNHQLVSNARKNITSLLETPLKEDGLPSSSGIILDPTNTPFTPMLKANLKDYTVGDTFSIDTPNFPVTPGLSLMNNSLMNNSPTSYCILNDTETNKATEAIILSEERKSSVRKTDDEDVDMSPKVYGCKELLEEFNKSRAGKKNLELLDNKGVNWEGSSDKEYKTDISESNSDNETNNTVIQNTGHPKGDSTRSPRISGKSMNVLKSRLLDKNKDPTDAFNISEKIPVQKLKTPEELENGPNESKKNNLKAEKTQDTTSSSDSEIIKKDNYKNKLIHVGENGNKKEVVSKSTKNKKQNIADEKNKKESTNKKHILVEEVKSKRKDDKDKKNNKERSVSRPDIVESTSVKEDTISNIASITTEVIKQTVLSATLGDPSSMRTGYSLQAEIDEKRKRIIELEKGISPRRRRTLKVQPNLNSPNKRRKRTVPKKLQNTAEEQSETSSDHGKVDSQDEFFKKSGSNLHRTNKNSGAGDVSEKVLGLRTKEKVDVDESKTESVPKAQKDNGGCEVKSDDKVTENLPTQSRTEAFEGQKTSKIKDQRQGAADMDSDSFSDQCVMELQSEEITCIHDEATPSQKRLEDYNFNLEMKKDLKVHVPLSDGTLQPVKIGVTPFKMLWEIKPSACSDNVDSSDSENGGSKTGDADEARCSRKRKQRSDSCNSDSSTKKMKTSLIPDSFNIEKLLTKLHGPSDKT